jgi:hypothetical protein
MTSLAQRLLTNLVLRPMNDLATGALHYERRLEFLYRVRFDDLLREPLFHALQAAHTFRRPDEHLALAEEKLLDDEAELIDEIISRIKGFTRDNWLPGGAERFGQTKTYGLVRGEFTVLDNLPPSLRQGVFATPRSFAAWVRFSNPGPFAPPDMDDIGQCSVSVKLLGVPGPKLMPDERHTQDLLLVSPASFVTANVRDNARLQAYVRSEVSLFYFLSLRHPRLLVALMQGLYARTLANPLEMQYYSNVPFLLGEGQAVEYSLKPTSTHTSPIPIAPGANYLREAMVKTLKNGDVTFQFMVQLQTDSHRMPIEDATVKWPEHLSPYVPVAELRIPAQRFDSDEQTAFCNKLAYNPWHSLAEHRPLGNQNRARKALYWQLAQLRQAMNGQPHVEPTGEEDFSAPVARVHSARFARRSPTTSNRAS